MIHELASKMSNEGIAVTLLLVLLNAAAIGLLTARLIILLKTKKAVQRFAEEWQANMQAAQSFFATVECFERGDGSHPFCPPAQILNSIQQDSISLAQNPVLLPVRIAGIVENCGARHLRVGMEFLTWVSTAAPLIGLVGSTMGIAACFAGTMQAAGTANPALVGGGVASSLVTTGLGIFVALLAQSGQRVLNRLASDLEEFNAFFGEQLLAMANAWAGSRPKQNTVIETEPGVAAEAVEEDPNSTF